MSVDASQTQITSVGTIGAGTWEGTCIANDYVCDSTTWIDTGGTGLTKSGSTLSVDASQTQKQLLVLLLQVHGKLLQFKITTFPHKQRGTEKLTLLVQV